MKRSRTIALALLMIFSWVLVAPILVPDAEANLPACCRKGGKHHCMMRGMQLPASNEVGISAIIQKCPCLPESTAATHAVKFAPEVRQRFHAEADCNLEYFPQTSAHFEQSFPNSHQRRGPPSPLA